ncbi:hypothetical protein NX801_04920 [Streptomyces sp. LP05-1]|uniref:Secreted protein n=1 Tax=Streptomyces pyxinae TaxID=2970734 RepID=A0ABT2CC93_9ACTN|nr:hypothetical protein [Streptomyces sp. LP05-1]MCS0635009.1 hypothetical protein [Streptomyces sp. LP05-1]
MAITIASRLFSGAAATAAAGVLVLSGSPAHATSSSQSWNINGGYKATINAWHCGVYTKACDWKTSTKLYKGKSSAKATWIQSRAVIKSHGISASLEISRNPSIKIYSKTKDQAEYRWKNNNTWISDASGQVKPGWSATHISTKSCGSLKIGKNINFKEKCVTAGAF